MHHGQKTYTNQGSLEYFEEKKVYQKLTKEEAIKNQNSISKNNLFLSNHIKSLSPSEWFFIHETLITQNDNLFKFRMSTKVHKTHWELRLIVCCVGTTHNYLSRWLDYQFQKLNQQISTYTNNSSQLSKIDQIKQPPKNQLFPSNAKLMYTNIGTSHAIHVLFNWMDSIVLLH